MRRIRSPIDRFGRAGGFRPASRASRAQLCIQYPSGKVDIGQPERNERARGVLGQAAIRPRRRRSGDVVPTSHSSRLRRQPVSRCDANEVPPTNHLFEHRLRCGRAGGMSATTGPRGPLRHLNQQPQCGGVGAAEKQTSFGCPDVSVSTLVPNVLFLLPPKPLSRSGKMGPPSGGGSVAQHEDRY